ncbi:class I SAM-dependent methyltransferase [Lacinutrix salivirga]
MSAPRHIVEVCSKFITPDSVVDFGCGLGTFLRAFKEKGATTIYGLDGKWTNTELLSKNIDLSEFKMVDLEQEIILNKQYDLAISLEVAEHLSPESASVFVKNLVHASDVVLFSAAIPNQGGQNHINEQWVNYWQEKFAVHNYVFLDVLRPLLWEEEEVNWWYKQNMFFVVKASALASFETVENSKKILNLIHPDHYLEKYKAHIDFRLGKGRTKLYLKLFLKSILYKLKLIK